MKKKILASLFCILGIIGVFTLGYNLLKAQTISSETDLMSVLRENTQKAAYNIDLNAPFIKANCGIKEYISSETGELNIQQDVVTLPGRNGMDLVLKAQYKNLDAKLFNETTRSDNTANTFGQTVIAIYDVFDQNGYWLRNGGLSYAANETITKDFQYGQENWKFTGNVKYQSGTTILTTGNIYNATQEKSQAAAGRNMLGTGWSFNLPYLETEDTNVYVHLQDGSTYKADFNTKNGLEKYELKDLMFDKYTAFNCDNKVSAYRLLFKDGGQSYFTSDGFLIGQRDRYNNTIRYFYQAQPSGTTVLNKIEDSAGRIVKIEYSDSSTVVTCGEKRVTMMKRLIRGQTNKYYLSGFIDPAGREIKYLYSTDTAQFDSLAKTPAVNTYMNLIEIQYPTTAKTVYTYTRGHKNLGASGSMEYFKIKERYEQNDNQKIDDLSYQYWNEPDGYPIYRNSSQIPELYRYETSIKNSKGLVTHYTFNGLHLPINVRVSGDRLVTETHKIYHSQSHLPLQAITRNYNEQGQYQEKDDYYEYDSRGNVIAENHPTGTDFTKSNERKINYIYDERYNLLLSKKYKQDADTQIELKYQLTPDGRSIISEETDANQKLMSCRTYQHDDVGNITAITSQKSDSEDVTTNFEYDDEFDKTYLTAKSTTVKDADGRSSMIKVQYDYDFKTGNQISATDANGNTTYFNYDLLSRLLKQTNPDQTIKTYQYDDKQNIVYTNDERNNQIIYYFDKLGKLIQVKDKQTGKELANLQYDNMENLLQEISPNGSYKQYTLDQMNRLISVGHFDRLGNNLSQTDVTYDEAYKDQSGQILQKITTAQKADPDQNDILTNYYFDLRAKLVKQGRLQDGQEYQAAFEYNYLDQCLQSTDFKGNTTTFTYDGLGRVIKQTNALGNSQTMEYDYLGNRISQTDELGHTTHIEYDGLGRAIDTRTPFENGIESINKIYYDPNGNVIQKIDPEGSVTRFSYSRRNQLNLVEQVLGPNDSNFNKYEYDETGNLNKVLSGLNSPHDIARSIIKYQYDDLNRLISCTDPAGKTEKYQYDDNGNLIKKYDRNGKMLEAMYDDLNRPITKQSAFDGKLEKTQYSYNRLGNITQMTDNTGITRYIYDSLGRLKTIWHDNGINLNYDYNILDQRTSMALKQTSDVLMDTKYDYDAVGKLTSVNEQGRTVKYQYDNANRLTDTLNQITGVDTKYTFNNAGMLKTLVNEQAGNIISHYEYEYDKRGNQISKNDKNGMTRYYYDQLSRLKTVTMPDENIQHYSYDNLGNITELMESSQGKLKLTNYSYNHNNQLLMQEENQGNDTTRYLFDYDNNGNQIQKDELQYKDEKMIGSKNTSFRYDNLNQLREITNPDGQKINYNYYGDGLRASKDIDGQITNFTYDGQNIILETDNTGLPTAKNFFGNQLISRQTNDDTYYYLFNGHGDVTQLLNQKGDIVKDYEYDPFGKNIENESPIKPGKISASIWRNEVENLDNPFQYAGEYQDKETGYYYLRARYYDPQIQRFISKDSVAGQLSNPLSMNLYSYCHNNPINSWDPSGHWQQGDEKLSTAAQKAITQASNAYLAAQAKGDQVGMNTAHETADAVRQMCAAGVWGGSSSGGGGSSGSTSSRSRVEPSRAGSTSTSVGPANAVWNEKSNQQQAYILSIINDTTGKYDAGTKAWANDQNIRTVYFFDANNNLYSSDEVLHAQHPGWYGSSSIINSASSTEADLDSVYYNDPEYNPFAPTYKGQCTWYCYGRAKEVSGLSMPTGNAREWVDQANNMGLNVNTDNLYDIRPGSIAVFTGGGGGNGHVVFVEDIQDDSVTISEFNYHIRRGYEYSTLTREQFYGRSYGSLKGYIYLK